MVVDCTPAPKFKMCHVRAASGSTVWTAALFMALPPKTTLGRHHKPRWPRGCIGACFDVFMLAEIVPIVARLARGRRGGAGGGRAGKHHFVQVDFGRVFLFAAALVFPAAGLDAALDVELRALFHVGLNHLGQAAIAPPGG